MCFLCGSDPGTTCSVPIHFAVLKPQKTLGISIAFDLRWTRSKRASGDRGSEFWQRSLVRITRASGDRWYYRATRWDP